MSLPIAGLVLVSHAAKEERVMKWYSYGERDHAFGQAMLTLRTSIGLTQAGLAVVLQKFLSPSI